MTPRLMDEETRMKLKSALPYVTKDGVPFTPSIYSDAEVAKEFIPVFYLRPLTIGESQSVRVAMREHGDTGLWLLDERTLNVCRASIVKWENVFDYEGREVVFDKADLAAFDSLNQAVKAELVTHMLTISGLGQIDKLGLKS